MRKVLVRVLSLIIFMLIASGLLLISNICFDINKFKETTQTIHDSGSSKTMVAAQYGVMEDNFDSIHVGDNIEAYAIDNKSDYMDYSDCMDYCKSHGPGRQDGGVNLLENGCRNYTSFEYNYGSKNIPYWINMSSMNQISDLTHRRQMLEDIRTQTAMWNEVKMYDGTGQIVNFYEVAPNTTTKPSAINDREVIEVLQCDISKVHNGEDYSTALGLFFREGRVEINYDIDIYGARQGYSLDTILHEFGHALGLGDIDTDSGVAMVHTKH